MTRRGLTLGWEEPPPFWEVRRKGTLDLKLRDPVTDPQAPPDPAQRQGDEMDSDSLSGLEQGSSREAGRGRGWGPLDVAMSHARVSPRMPARSSPPAGGGCEGAVHVAGTWVQG